MLTCPDNNYPHAISLGLPSGTKWCCCNVAANTPESSGGYYAWGETAGKDNYNITNYAHTYTNNLGNQECSYIGDDIAGTSYDAAFFRIGEPWRMPTAVQIQELLDNCTHQMVERVDESGMVVKGILFTGSNNGQIFLPAAGFYYWADKTKENERGCYGSSTYNNGMNAYNNMFTYDYNSVSCNPTGFRVSGYPIPAVCP